MSDLDKCLKTVHQQGTAWLLCRLPHGHKGDCAHDLDQDDLALICETAFEWAGEYGFASPDHAAKVWDAAKRLRPDLEPKRPA